jgi:hypothetical protein
MSLRRLLNEFNDGLSAIDLVKAQWALTRQFGGSQGAGDVDLGVAEDIPLWGRFLGVATGRGVGEIVREFGDMLGREEDGEAVRIVSEFQSEAAWFKQRACRAGSVDWDERVRDERGERTLPLALRKRAIQRVTMGSGLVQAYMKVMAAQDVEDNWRSVLTDLCRVLVRKADVRWGLSQEWERVPIAEFDDDMIAKALAGGPNTVYDLLDRQSCN